MDDNKIAEIASRMDSFVNLVTGMGTDKDRSSYVLRDYVAEYCGFPFTSFDDQVDVTTQALNASDRSYDKFLNAMGKVRDGRQQDS